MLVLWAKSYSFRVSWQDQKYFLDSVARSYTFQFFSCVKCFFAKCFISSVSWVSLRILGKFLDFLGFLAKTNLLHGLLGKIKYTSTDLFEKSCLLPFLGEIDYSSWVFWQDPILLRFFLGKILDFFSFLGRS